MAKAHLNIGVAYHHKAQRDDARKHYLEVMNLLGDKKIGDLYTRCLAMSNFAELDNIKELYLEAQKDLRAAGFLTTADALQKSFNQF